LRGIARRRDLVEAQPTETRLEVQVNRAVEMHGRN